MLGGERNRFSLSTTSPIIPQCCCSGMMSVQYQGRGTIFVVETKNNLIYLVLVLSDYTDRIHEQSQLGREDSTVVGQHYQCLHFFPPTLQSCSLKTSVPRTSDLHRSWVSAVSASYSESESVWSGEMIESSWYQMRPTQQPSNQATQPSPCLWVG